MCALCIGAKDMLILADFKGECVEGNSLRALLGLNYKNQVRDDVCEHERRDGDDRDCEDLLPTG